jgi:phage terminase large subunit-like protein
MYRKSDIAKKQLEIEAAKIGIECFNSFYFFFKTFWSEMSGDQYVDSPHIKYICDVVQDKAMKIIRNEFSMETLIINVPPGSSKSTIITIAFPIWIWLHAPYLASTNVSYSARLSERHAKKARAITDSDKWHLLFDNIFILKYGKKLEILTQNMNEMVNNFKGERFNTSVDGTITGMHADFVLKDDMQDPKQAKSDAEREHVNIWDEETLTSRHKRPNCWLDIIIAQKLHENDLSGYTMNKNISITLLSFPAEITHASPVVPKDAESIYTNGILDPNRRPKEVLEVIKSQMGSVAYTCQFLQTPFNLEEQDIQPKMFEILDSHRDDLVFDLWIDGAYTEKTINDPSGLDLIAKDGNNIIWKESWDVYKKLPDLLKFIVELENNGTFNKEKGRIFIEPKASGNSLADYIEFDTDYNFVRIGEHSKQESKLVQGGHTARHQVIKPKAESHRIKCIKGNWNDNAIVQICGFPRASHDEHVDNLGYAINHYYFAENTFIELWSLKGLEKNVAGSVGCIITSKIENYKFSVDYKENDSGDTMLFDIPNKQYNYRYLTVLVLKSEGERGGDTVILTYDRLNQTVPMIYRSNEIVPVKAAKKALEIASLYSMAKLVVAVQDEYGQSDL